MRPSGGEVRSGGAHSVHPARHSEARRGRGNPFSFTGDTDCHVGPAARLAMTDHDRQSVGADLCVRPKRTSRSPPHPSRPVAVPPSPQREGTARPEGRALRRRKLHIVRFRLAAKARSFRCSSSPHRTRGCRRWASAGSHIISSPRRGRRPGGPRRGQSPTPFGLRPSPPDRGASPALQDSYHS